MEPIIEVRDYVKIIKEQTILDHIELSLEPGLIHGFIGHNGSGKTMLFKAICGFIQPTSGQVLVRGERIGVDRDFPNNVGIIIEQPHFLPELNAFDNLKLLAGIQKKIGDKEIREVIRRVDLDPASKKRVRAFSLGMKQRLAIAQAIMEEPDLLILDEPMNSLDKEGVAFARELLAEWRARGATILLCSHTMEDIHVLCDHIWRLESGRIEQVQ